MTLRPDELYDYGIGYHEGAGAYAWYDPIHVPSEVEGHGWAKVDQKSDVWTLGMALLECWYPAFLRADPLLQQQVDFKPSNQRDFALFYQRFSEYAITKLDQDEMPILICSMIVNDPAFRVSAKTALQHPLFKII